MLVRFTVENFLSFRERCEFSMIKGRERLLKHHVVDGEIPLLKAAVIYGANASGKSNLVKAIDVARDMLIQGARPKEALPITPFKLDIDCIHKPSRMEFEIKVGEKYYAYGFVADSKKIHEEWLYAVINKKDKCIFERKTANSQAPFDLSGLTEILNSKDRDFLEFTARGTLPNRLFLTECQERNVRDTIPSAKVLFDVLEWFQRLTVIFPRSKYGGLENGVHADLDFRQKMGQLLQSFDTGISDLTNIQIIPQPPSLLRDQKMRDILSHLMTMAILILHS